MVLDGLTLIAAGAFVGGVCALLLLIAWTQIRAPALLWWAAAAAINAAGVSILAGGLVTGDLPAIVIGGLVSTFSSALYWGGLRSFFRRRQIYSLFAVAILANLAAGPMTAAGAPETAGAAIGFALWVLYLGAGMYELWHSRAEQLSARWPLIGFFGLHAFVFLGGVFDALNGSLPPGVMPPLSSWFSIIHFETLLFAAGTTLFMVLMAKERSELGHMIAARHDSLTGIANRGAFLESAARALNRSRGDGTPLSVIMFDLDHFKWVNDTFGHEVGDEVLRTFSETTRGVLRPNDLFGRYGGEEFVVVLPGATVEAAFVIADRARHKFAEASTVLEGHALNATVSAGVTGATPQSSLDDLIRTADQCMYRAKHLGRNRVERSVDAALKPAGNVIRVA